MYYLWTIMRYLLPMRRFFSCLCLSALLVVGGIETTFAQEAKTKIQNAYQQFKNGPSLTNGVAALTVINSKTGQIVFEENSKIGLPTASTLKVMTSITALDLLGPDYTFPTHLYYTGAVDSIGTLNGNLIIEGFGDPTLGSERYPTHNAETVLNKWKAAIKALGIKQINGLVIADDKFYKGNQVPGTWMWTDMGNYYGAGVSALNWKENAYDVDFSVSRPGAAASIKSHNIPPFYQVINEVTTGANGSGDNVYGYSAPYSKLIYLRGTYGADLKKTIELSTPDPALSLVYDLSKALTADSIVVADSMITTATLLKNAGISNWDANKQKILTIQSPKLIEIVHWFNQKSINLYGEAILKAIGGISANKYETEDAATLVAKYWENKLKLPVGEIKTYDGSGLSPQNRVTSNALARVMQYAQGRPWFADFKKGLPTINGMTMKSGTIGGTLGYTGYQTAADGTSYTFSLLINNYHGGVGRMRQQMFKLLDVLK